MKNALFLTETKYEEITSTIEVKAVNVPENIDVSFKSSCGKSQMAIHTDKCTDVDFGQNVQFTASVFAKKCADDPQTFTISQVGLDQVHKYFVNFFLLNHIFFSVKI